MFYAASEIVFWILLSAILGGGIGYGLSQGKSVQIGKRLSESRADAPMERELAVAWDTIEDLNRRLQVAHETIRGGIADGSADAEIDDLLLAEPPSEDTVDELDETPVDEIPEDEDEDAQDEDADDDSLIPFDGPELAGPLVHTVEEVVPADEIDEDTGSDADGAVGTRLADRVASASIGNQVEVIKTVEF